MEKIEKVQALEKALNCPFELYKSNPFEARANRMLNVQRLAKLAGEVG